MKHAPGGGLKISEVWNNDQLSVSEKCAETKLAFEQVGDVCGSPLDPKHSACLCQRDASKELLDFPHPLRP